MVGNAMTELCPIVGVSLMLRKEDMVGNAMTGLSTVVGMSLVLRKEDMVGSLDRVISCCRCVLGAQERRYVR